MFFAAVETTEFIPIDAGTTIPNRPGHTTSTPQQPPNAYIFRYASTSIIRCRSTGVAHPLLDRPERRLAVDQGQTVPPLSAHSNALDRSLAGSTSHATGLVTSSERGAGTYATTS
jgi:hypothetical protein